MRLTSAKGRRHKSLVQRARGLIGQAVRWLPGRALTVVADSGYAAIELLAWCQRLPAPVTLITRLRLDAALYTPAPARAAGQKGRPRRKGRTAAHLGPASHGTADTIWSRVRVHWYGGAWRWLEVASDTAVWYHSGLPPVALRWVLIRDPKGRSEPQALLSTDDGPASRADHQPHSCAAGRWKSPSRKPARTWAWKVSASGTIWPSHVPPRCVWRSSPWSLCHRATATRLAGVRAAGRVVSKGVADLLGCARSSPPLPLAATGFLHVSQRHRQRKPPADLFEHLGEMLAYAA